MSERERLREAIHRGLRRDRQTKPLLRCDKVSRSTAAVLPTIAPPTSIPTVDAPSPISYRSGIDDVENLDQIRQERAAKIVKSVAIALAIIIGVPVLLVVLFIGGVLFEWRTKTYGTRQSTEVVTRMLADLGGGSVSPISDCVFSTQSSGIHGDGSDWYKCKLRLADIAFFREQIIARSGSIDDDDGVVPSGSSDPWWWPKGMKGLDTLQSDIVWIGINHQTGEIYILRVRT